MTQQLRIGSYTNTPEPFMGPVISQESASQLVDHFKNLIQLGGIEHLPLIHTQTGTGFLSPGIIDVSSIDMLPDEEYFGPLLQVSHALDFNHAISLANDTRFGLSSSLLSDSHIHFDQFYKESTAGIINWNQPTCGASSAAPFGGTGESGNHRPSAYFAADYCSYPVASIQSSKTSLPDTLLPGVSISESPL